MNRARFSAIVLTVTVAATIAIQSIAAQSGGNSRRERERFSIIELGTLGGAYSEAIAINHRGEIAGQSDNPANMLRAFFWVNGDLTDVAAPESPQNFAVTLNNRGQVLGYFNHGPGGEEHSFLWHRGTFTDLGTLGGAYTLPSGSRTALNDHGQVIAESTTADGEWRPWFGRTGK